MDNSNYTQYEKIDYDCIHAWNAAVAGRCGIRPEQRKQGVVIAEPTKVRLRVEGEYGEKVLYDRTFNVSAAQWKAFKSGLAKRKVRNDSRVEPMCGAQGGFLEVSANGKLLFRAVESDGLKYDGSLLDAYKVLLPKGKPQKILDDPSTILPQI